MSDNICHICLKPLDMKKEKYTAVWELPRIHFVHYECGENLLIRNEAQEWKPPSPTEPTENPS